MDILTDLLSDSTMTTILMVLVIVNVLFSAATQVLDVLKKPLNETHWAFKAIGLIQKAIDFLSANKQHKKD
jgi:hypothetical protein